MNNHFADVSKKDTMSLTLALIVLDRLNTTERIDVARDDIAEAVQVVSAAAKYRIPQKAEKRVQRVNDCVWKKLQIFVPIAGKRLIGVIKNERI